MVGVGYPKVGCDSMGVLDAMLARQGMDFLLLIVFRFSHARARIAMDTFSVTFQFQEALVWAPIVVGTSVVTDARYGPTKGYRVLYY